MPTIASLVNNQSPSLMNVLRSRRMAAYGMVPPLFTVIVGPVAYPFRYSVNLSMENKRETKFVGLWNHERLLDWDSFWLAIGNSFRLPLLSKLISVTVMSSAIVASANPDDCTQTLAANVEVVETPGAEVQLNVKVGDSNMVARVDPRTKAAYDRPIELAVNMNKIHLFEEGGGRPRIRTEER